MPQYTAKVIEIGQPYKAFVPSGYNPYLMQTGLCQNVVVEYTEVPPKKTYIYKTPIFQYQWSEK